MSPYQEKYVCPGLGFFNVASDKEFGDKNRFVVWPHQIIVSTCICDHYPSFMRTFRKALFTHLKKAVWQRTNSGQGSFYRGRSKYGDSCQSEGLLSEVKMNQATIKEYTNDGKIKNIEIE
jgi:hypothetical protein